MDNGILKLYYKSFELHYIPISTKTRKFNVPIVANKEVYENPKH